MLAREAGLRACLQHLAPHGGGCTGRRSARQPGEAPGQGLGQLRQALRRWGRLQARIDAWNQLDGCELPIYEPGLEEVVQAARGRNLYFSSDTHKHVAEGDVIFVRCCPPPGQWLPGQTDKALATLC